MVIRILVIGSGIAGISCAKLFADAGWKVEILEHPGSRVPLLILNDVTCAVLIDIWQDPRLLRSFKKLSGRTVLWDNATPAFMDDSATIVEGNVLSERLLHALKANYGDQVHLLPKGAGFAAFESYIEGRLSSSSIDYDWIIDASGRKSSVRRILATSHRIKKFGRRSMINSMVSLRGINAPDRFTIETTPEGWLLLTPIDERKGLLQIVLPTEVDPRDVAEIIKNAINATRLMKMQVAEILPPTIMLEASPQIIEPLYGNNWISIGDSAVSFDPISGEGAGNALRESILATAVLKGIASGMAPDRCLQYYDLRLRRALLQHVTQCISFYSSVFTSEKWKEEIELGAREKDDMDPLLPEKLDFRLQGTNLIEAR